MADNNQRYVWTPSGRKITYERWLYEQTVHQESVLRNVNALAMDEATAAVSAGSTLGQQEYGGLLRVVIPNILDKYGNINAEAAVQYYDQLVATNGYSQRAAAKITAATRSLAKRDAAQFKAEYATDYKLAEKSERVIGWAMKVRAKDGHEPSVVAMNNALSREVASYHRDTVLFNAALDPYVKGVQRVAQANACAFCRLMALGSTRGKVRVTEYAVKFHDHCHCTIQPLFEGDEPVRPPYYDEFDKQYEEASRESEGYGFKSLMRTYRAKDRGEQAFTTGAKGWGYQKASTPKPYESVNDFIADRDAFLKHVADTPKSRGDSALDYVLGRMGYNAKPELVDTFEQLGGKPMFRGIADSDKPGSHYARAYVQDERPFQGRGVFGNGTYFAEDPRGALGYATGSVPPENGALGEAVSSSSVIKAALKPDARVMTFQTEMSYYEYMARLEQEYQDSLAKAGLTDESMGDLVRNAKSPGILMALQGVDAYVIEPRGYTVVLNRGALKVVKP